MMNILNFTRDQKKRVFIIFLAILGWYFGFFLLIRGMAIITIHWNFFDWTGPICDARSMWSLCHIVGGLVVLRFASKYIDDIVTRAIALLPVLLFTYIAFEHFESWTMQTLNPNELFGRRAFTPAWFAFLECLFTLMPLVIWSLTFEFISEMVKKFVSYILLILLKENNSYTKTMSTSQDNGLKNEYSSRTRNDRSKHEESVKSETKAEDPSRDGYTSRLREALATLGLGNRATRTEIRNAYRDLVQVWHPDRFAHSPKLRAKAQRKLSEINNAYELLGKHLDEKQRSC